MKIKKITIIGCGKLGSNLGLHLAKSGFEVSFESRSISSAKNIALMLKSNKFTDKIGDLSKDADVLFLTVTDDKIAYVFKKIKKNLSKNTILFHTSGALSSRILTSDKKKLIGSFHPVQSFSKIYKKNPFENIIIGIESDNDIVRKAGETIAKKLFATPFFIQPESKALYHCACCIASNYLVVLIHFAFSVLEKTGIKEDSKKILLPLIKNSLKNIENLGVKEALTGPISRNDFKTVEKHIESIKENTPDFLNLYKELGSVATDLASLKDNTKLKKILKSK